MSDADYSDTPQEAPEPVIQEGGEGGEVQAREPLSYEEMERRWKNSDTARREERTKRQKIEREFAEVKAERESRAGEPDPFETIAASLRDDLDDPLTDIEALKKAVRTVAQQQAAQRQQEATSAAEQRKNSDLARTVAEHEKDFHADNPDYFDAVKHLTSARAEELSEAGLNGNALTAKVNGELREVVQMALEQGRDPAAVIYAMSKKRGFGIDSADKTLQTIQSGQRAGLSLSQAGGKNGSTQLTWATVSGLKGRAFTEGFEKLRAQEKRRA